jgi:hypothetical protein
MATALAARVGMVQGGLCRSLGANLLHRNVERFTGIFEKSGLWYGFGILDGLQVNLASFLVGLRW